MIHTNKKREECLRFRDDSGLRGKRKEIQSMTVSMNARRRKQKSCAHTISEFWVRP